MGVTTGTGCGSSLETNTFFERHVGIRLCFTTLLDKPDRIKWSSVCIVMIFNGFLPPRDCGLMVKAGRRLL